MDGVGGASLMSTILEMRDEEKVRQLFLSMKYA